MGHAYFFVMSLLQKIRSMLTTHGLPKKVVSDNGSVFTSSIFENFLQKNGIHYIRTASYHPALNSLAERAETRTKEAH